MARPPLQRSRHVRSGLHRAGKSLPIRAHSLLRARSTIVSSSGGRSTMRHVPLRIRHRSARMPRLVRGLAVRRRGTVDAAALRMSLGCRSCSL
eukprot:scaffold726_cov262-Pinguiococcus_pyrenoidosus.AAC.15